MRLVDEAGLDGFSFRNLAQRLGCQAMSIYHYYPSKAHLFEALVDICIQETPVPDPGDDWRAALWELMQNFRKTALRHPGFFLYFITFRLNNRSGLAFLDRVLRIMEATGLEASARARHFRTIGYYMMGAGIDEALGYAHGPSAVEPVPAEEAARDFPAISAVGPFFADRYHKPTFEAGLTVLINQLEAEARAAKG
jgi:AcrR family transcriptional regulator